MMSSKYYTVCGHIFNLNKRGNKLLQETTVIQDLKISDIGNENGLINKSEKTTTGKSLPVSHLNSWAGAQTPPSPKVFLLCAPCVYKLKLD